MFVKYFKVYLNKSRDYIFPKNCVLCGKGGVKEEQVFDGNFGGHNWMWKRISKAHPKLNIPAHVKCKESFKRKERIHLFVFFLAWLIMTGIFEITNKSTISIEYCVWFTGILVCYNILVNKFFSPIQFLFLVYDDKITFYFLDKKYYEKFNELNKENLFKNNIFLGKM